MWADGQTRKTLIIIFRYFSNVPHKHVLLKAIRYPHRKRDSVVGVVTRPRVRWSGVRIPEGAKVSGSPKSSNCTLGSTQLSIQCVPGSFPGVKRGAKLFQRLHLEPKLRMCGAILPNPTE